jgi:beta-N-acetylhexosaminidase
MPTKIQNAGSRFILGFSGTNLEDPGVQEIVYYLENCLIGGIIFFAHNIESPKQIKTLTDSFKLINKDIILATDQEGGFVQRLSARNGFSDFLSPFKVSTTLSTQEAYEHYSIMAKTLAEAGINLNCAPCVDIHDADCPIIGKLERSFSSDVEQIIKMTRIFKQAHIEHGVEITLKHFPGHGHSRTDTHQGYTNITNYTNPITELEPFRVLADEVNYIMTAHVVNSNIDPLYPATISDKYIKPLLRSEFNFKGKILSDDIIMGAILDSYDIEFATQRALLAGCDYIILSFHPSAMQGNTKLPKDFSYLRLLEKLGDLNFDNNLELDKRKISKI